MKADQEKPPGAAEAAATDMEAAEVSGDEVVGYDDVALGWPAESGEPSTVSSSIASVDISTAFQASELIVLCQSVRSRPPSERQRFAAAADSWQASLYRDEAHVRTMARMLFHDTALGEGS